MGHPSELVQTLKGVLKSKGITYKELAGQLGLSEVTVKRMFAGCNLSLDRLDAILRIIEMDFFDLVSLSKREHLSRKYLLTLEQEKGLAEDPDLFAFFLLLLNGWPLDSILAKYDFTEAQSLKMLLGLDRLKLLELYPGNRFLMRIKNKIYWNRRGPLWARYQKELLMESLNYPFNAPLDRIAFIPAMLSQATIGIILNKIDALIREFGELADLDAAIPPESRKSFAFFLGFRPWVFSPIRKKLRKPEAG